MANAAYKRVIHKEERDIVHEPRHPFSKTYDEYRKTMAMLRSLIGSIHVANHTSTVKFKDDR